ncbi:Glyoxylase, beta-lactamase superfamily II [Loktanella fryxellensis]|uniref:Glyoxylase, beta-lactamase superfamily II n=1 Tax=Loktanella fryxellensis TaxID=245187 RepID=A0A1H8JSH7_9RHOB|nr:MBL fold metallo-hydrolase [Loktanella fryxellensis]SEN83511.1 Glyoxylase, beta-lactamase superfamily II [Loktanella fryxellensis]
MDQQSAPVVGVAEAVARDLVRVLAPNPSAMTGWGTNSYVLGADRVVVVDPGPDDAVHLAALVRTIAGRAVSHIVVTHAHADHSPLARPLSRLTGAPVCGFGPADAGRSAVMQALVAAGYAGGGEGVDAGFAPDVALADGAVLDTGAGPLRVLHTPGHMGNHICLGWRDAAFSGDLVMGWTTSLISPPDGDIVDFIASCGRLRVLGAKVLYPGHGAPVTDPAARIDWLLAHRAERRAQVLAALDVPRDVAGLTAAVYTDVSPALWPIAARNVFAQLVALVGEGAVRAAPDLSPTSVFHRTGP